MADLCYAKSNVSLKSFTPVFRRWIDITIAYAKENPDDSSWSYNERATLSTFAGAAWREGWFALEEFGIDKHTGERDADTGKKLQSFGRCDLYLDNGARSYALEAKQAWQPIGPRVLAGNYAVKEKLRSAFRDIGRIPKIEADRRLAITFVAPSFPSQFLRGISPDRRTPKQRSTALIQDWLSSLRDIPAVHAIAWCFPGVTRCLTNEKRTRVFPGVVALVRECKKSPKVATA